MDKLVKLIRQEFFQGLEKQTSWGRNQVKEVFERSMSNALALRLNESADIPPVIGEAIDADFEVVEPEFEFERPKKEYPKALPPEEYFGDDFDDSNKPWGDD